MMITMMISHWQLDDSIMERDGLMNSPKKNVTKLVRLDQDELYPYYSYKVVQDGFHGIAEIDAKTYKRWERIQRQWESMQDEIKELWVRTP